MIKNIAIFIAAAICEIIGCYSIFRMIDSKQPLIWGFLGSVCLLLFAFLLTFEYQDGTTGRTFIIYGGIYIAISMIWLLLFEKIIPSFSDLVGLSMILSGAFVIYKQILD